MQKIHFSIFINAPREKVWEVMLADKTYREWTAPFNPGGSYFKGTWEKGSKILFIGPGEDGKEGGMVSEIADSRPCEFISIHHIGILENGIEKFDGPEVEKWSPAFENYTFNEKDGGTEVLVDLDVNEEYKDMFSDTWPKALEILKGIAER